MDILGAARRLWPNNDGVTPKNRIPFYSFTKILISPCSLYVPIISFHREKVEIFQLMLILMIQTPVPGCNLCKVTHKDMLGPLFEENAPKRFEIAPKEEINDPELSAVILGQVLNKRCEPIRNAVVDVWFAGGKQGMMSTLTIPILNVKYNYD